MIDIRGEVKILEEALSVIEELESEYLHKLRVYCKNIKYDNYYHNENPEQYMIDCRKELYEKLESTDFKKYFNVICEPIIDYSGYNDKAKDFKIGIMIKTDNPLLEDVFISLNDYLDILKRSPRY